MGGETGVGEEVGWAVVEPSLPTLALGFPLLAFKKNMAAPARITSSRTVIQLQTLLLLDSWSSGESCAEECGSVVVGAPLLIVFTG